MNDEVKALIEIIKKIERETLEKSQQVGMQVFAVEKSGNIHMAVITEWKSDRSVLTDLGRAFRKANLDVKTLVLVAGSYMIAADMSVKRTPDEEYIILAVQRGLLKISELPDIYTHLRIEQVLIMVSDNEGKDIYMEPCLQHITRKDGTVEILPEREIIPEEIRKKAKTTDRMTSYIWGGYLGRDPVIHERDENDRIVRDVY